MEDLEVLSEVKSKSIIIDGDLHGKLKKLCKGKNLKIGAVVQDLIVLYVTNPPSIQKLIDEVKDINSAKK